MTLTYCGSLPHDVPAGARPVAANEQWRATVAAAGYQCQCTGRCGRSHSKSRGRCDKTLRGPAGVRLFAVPAQPGSTVLEAVCGRCADGYRAADHRHRAQAAAQRADEAPSLLDLLTETPEQA
jgi:hypothetical protein